MYRYFLALRYVLSRPINALGVIGTALGVWALIVVVSIFQGYLTEFEAQLTGAQADLTIVFASKAQHFDDYRDTLLADENVAGVEPRILSYGLLLRTGGVRPRYAGVESATGIPGAEGSFVNVVGIDVATARETSALDEWLENCRTPALAVTPDDDILAPTGERPTILVSEARALAHGLERGSTMRFSTGRVGGYRILGERTLDIVEAEVSIGGAFRTQFAAFDGVHVFADIDTVREWLGKPADFVSEIAIRLHDPARVEETRERLMIALNASERRLILRTPQEINAGELGSISHQTALMKLVLFVIMVVAGFLVFATLSMMVTEKTHDIGILTALGASRSGILTVFLACGVTISLVGTLLGVATGCVSAIYTDAFNTWLRDSFGVDLFPPAIYNLTSVPCELDVTWILQVSVAQVTLGLLVSGIPAWRAARHDPLVSLRAE